MSRYWPPIIPSVASTSSRATSRRLVREREPERLGEERVAGEQRDALAERDVRARASAALVVVVQRGQVVVDERERVHELERGRRGKRVLDEPRRPPRRPRGRGRAGSACRPTRARSAAPPRGPRAPARARARRGTPRRRRAARQPAASARFRARVSSASICFASSASSAMRSTAASPSTSSAAASRSSSSRRAFSCPSSSSRACERRRSRPGRHAQPPPLARDAAEDAVDEPRRVLGRVALREHDRLVDRDLARHRLLLELVDADAQDVALERTEPVGGPVGETRR